VVTRALLLLSLLTAAPKRRETLEEQQGMVVVATMPVALVLVPMLVDDEAPEASALRHAGAGSPCSDVVGTKSSTVGQQKKQARQKKFQRRR
jgi:hypothetical protein